MLRIISLFFAAIIFACGILENGPANARGNAAMQVCADILAQYGITPEGCDPQEDSRRIPESGSEETTPSDFTDISIIERQELEENNVFFKKGGDLLDTDAREKLNTIGQILDTLTLRTACIRLVGHSDASGPAGLNREMGYKRAQAVAQYLRPLLADPNRIAEISSDGEDNLLPNHRPESPTNRRVTIFARHCPLP